MEYTWASHKKPIDTLAQMANINKIPFRSMCGEYDADHVLQPMLSSKAIRNRHEKN